MKDTDIRRGDIFYVRDVEYSNGSEQNSGRPGIVISSDHGNRTSDNVIVVYMTAKEKRPMVIHADVMGAVPATALCEQVFTVSKGRLGRYMRTCTEAEMQAIDQALAYSIGLVGRRVHPTDEQPSKDGGAEREEELEALLEAEKATAAAYKRRIDYLENELKDAEESYEAFRAENKKLIEENRKVKEEFSGASLETYAEKIRLEAERDVYKGIVDRMFA